MTTAGDIIFYAIAAAFVFWLAILLIALIVIPFIYMDLGYGWREGLKEWNEFRKDYTPFGIKFWTGEAK